MHERRRMESQVAENPLINQFPQTGPKDIPLETILYYRSKNLNYAEIARQVGCDKSNISRRLAEFDPEIQSTEHYTGVRKFIFNNLERKLLAGITDDKINKSGLKDNATALGIVFDKRRLEEGLSTENIEVHSVDEINQLREVSKMLANQLKSGDIKQLELHSQNNDVVDNSTAHKIGRRKSVKRSKIKRVRSKV
jgi:hypothetical protein